MLTFVENEETDESEYELQLRVLRGGVSLFVADVWYHCDKPHSSDVFKESRLIIFTVIRHLRHGLSRWTLLRLIIWVGFCEILDWRRRLDIHLVNQSLSLGDDQRQNLHEPEVN